jgi:antitoxin MazE
MKTRIQKWGNSLALRIPKSFAEEVGLRDESSVEVSLAKGKLIVAPIATKPKFTLKQLLAQITDDNLHGEFDTGAPMGNEAW